VNLKRVVAVVVCAQSLMVCANARGEAPRYAVETVAGNGEPGDLSSEGGDARAMPVDQPFGVEIGPDGALYAMWIALREGRSADRKAANAVASILNHDDGSLSQWVGGNSQHVCEPLDYMIAARIVETKENDTRQLATTGCDDLAKIEVERDDDSILRNGFCKNLTVGQSLKAFVAQVRSVVSRCPEPINHAPRDSHVCQESHGTSPSWNVNLFLREPSGILERLADIVGFEVGIVGEDLLLGSAVGDLPDDDRYADAHAADCGAPAEDLWIERDAIKHCLDSAGEHQLSNSTIAAAATRPGRTNAAYMDCTAGQASSGTRA